MNQVVSTKQIQETIVNTRAFLGVMIPFGISRIAVRGFKASYFRSRYLLNAIAALRAKIMHNTTSINFMISCCQFPANFPG